MRSRVAIARIGRAATWTLLAAVLAGGVLVVTGGRRPVSREDPPRMVEAPSGGSVEPVEEADPSLPHDLAASAAEALAEPPAGPGLRPVIRDPELMRRLLRAIVRRMEAAGEVGGDRPRATLEAMRRLAEADLEVGPDGAVRLSPGEARLLARILRSGGFHVRVVLPGGPPGGVRRVAIRGGAVPPGLRD
jgi:hypothetical protein